MTFAALILLLVSAVIHAAWNLLGKRAAPNAAFFLVANTAGTLCFLPCLLVDGHFLTGYSRLAWVFVGATGIFQAIYYTGLAGAYRGGELSVAYPLARGVPVLLVTVLTSLLEQRPISSCGLVGLLAVAVGALLLPLQNFGDLNLKRYQNASCLLALVAAVGTAGYSMVDDAALRHLRGLPGLPASMVRITLLYAFIEGISTSLVLLLVVLPFRRGRDDLKQVLQSGLRPAAGVGAMIMLTYGLVLVAMTLVTNVSYIVAFRQSSILLGAIAAMFWLKEPCTAPKYAGLGLLFAGLILVAVYP